MFVNPIGVVNSINKKGNVKSNKVQQPTFKRENYMRVFNSEYSKRMWPENGIDQIGKMYDNLKNAANTMLPAMKLTGFRESILPKGFFSALGHLRGLFADDPDMVELAKLTKKRGKFNIIWSNNNIVLETIDNGQHVEDNAISRALRKMEDHDVERRNIEIAFSSLDDSRGIIFGMDYDGDIYVTRTHRDTDKIDDYICYYNSNNQRKAVIKDNIIERYNRDGSKWTDSQWIASGIGDSIRSTFKAFTDW